MNGPEILTVTPEELHCLGALGGAPAIPGLRPMPAYDEVTARLALGSALRSLEARGLLDDTEPALEERTRGVIETLAHPEWSVLTCAAHAAGVDLRSFAAKGASAAALTPLSSGDYELEVFERDRLIDAVLSFLALEDPARSSEDEHEVEAEERVLSPRVLAGAIGLSEDGGKDGVPAAELVQIVWQRAHDDHLGGEALAWLDYGRGSVWLAEEEGTEDGWRLRREQRGALAGRIRTGCRDLGPTGPSPAPPAPA